MLGRGTKSYGGATPAVMGAHLRFKWSVNLEFRSTLPASMGSTGRNRPTGRRPLPAGHTYQAEHPDQPEHPYQPNTRAAVAANPVATASTERSLTAAIARTVSGI